MASKYERITDLYLQTVGEVATPEVWPKFLTTACYNFRLSFDKQILLYAQRPDATAVLPIEGRQGWNQRFGRWVNRGSKGIAILDSDSNGQARIKYYFDIADTHEGRYPRPVPIWTVRPELEQAIIETLENSFGSLDNKENLGDALLSAASNVMEDNFQDYLAELAYHKEGSFLEPLDGESLEAIFKPLLQNSIGYILLVRCGIDPAEHFKPEDFSYISGFNTLQTINALGTATSDISQMCLSEIARTVLSIQRENRTFAEPAEKEYAVAENQPERSMDYDTDHIHEAGRLSSSQPSPAPGAADTPWEVRVDAPQILTAEPESDLHEPSDLGAAPQPLDGDRGDRPESGGADRHADGAGPGRDGGDERYEPDAVGGPDEQLPRGGGGAGAGGADLRIESELPPFLEERFITSILENRNDDLKSPKKEIQNFFREHYGQSERAEYLKSVYPDRYTELIVDDTRIGYKATDDGLLMWEGAYLSRTKESVFSWGIIAELTGNLIEQGGYFLHTKPDTPPSLDDQQIYYGQV